MSLLSLALSGIRLILGALGIWDRIDAWFAARTQQRAGANAQAAAEAAASAAATASIAQAEASAPKTDDMVDARLEDHSI